MDPQAEIERRYRNHKRMAAVISNAKKMARRVHKGELTMVQARRLLPENQHKYLNRGLVIAYKDA